MPTLPSAIFFDLDDTLSAFGVVSAPAWEACCTAFVAENPCGLTAREIQHAISEKSRWYWGDADRHRMKRADMLAARREVVALAFDALGLSKDAAHALADSFYQLHHDMQYLFPDTLPTLNAIKAEGIPMVLITNGSSQSQREKIDRHGLAAYFDHILIEGEFGVGKPDPRVYRHALDLVGEAPQAVWMVGDNLTWDVGAPQALGIYGIWYDAYGTGLPADAPTKPDRIISRLADLLV